jgi:hypothetical protein
MGGNSLLTKQKETTHQTASCPNLPITSKNFKSYAQERPSIEGKTVVHGLSQE